MDSAPLTLLTFTSPGAMGLNTQLANTPLPHLWATRADNCIFSDSGVLTVREGWELLNSDADSLAQDPVKQLFEYDPLTGNPVMVSALDNKIYTGTATLTNKTGVLTPTDDNWQFVNFNGSVYGLQSGHPLIKWSGSGDFAAVSAGSGTVPNGNALLSAFGRLWGTTSDGQTFKSSTLLGDSAWTGAGTGAFTCTNVWSGQDRIVALAAFNSLLVVFGERNILLFADGSGSSLGLDPANAYVVDSVSGVGCIARDSVQNVNGEDLVFLSHNGVMSLRRVLESRSNPLRDVSKNVRDYLRNQVANSDLDDIRSAFLPSRGWYLLLLPALHRTLVFDTRQVLEDGTWKVTQWRGHSPTTYAALRDGRTLYSAGTARLYEYGGYNDDGAAYPWTFESGWIQVDPEVANRVKALKRIGALIEATGGGTLTLKWAFDFSRSFTSVQKTFVPPGVGGEWGVGEWGTAEFGASTGLVEIEVPSSNSGQFIKVGLDFQVDGVSLVLDYIQLFQKIGRLT